jgi:hypothetical protein
MKKILLALIALMSINIAMAQNCTADPQFTAPGVYPDSATGIPAAFVGVPYNETITTITPVDTCIVLLFPPCTTLPIDSVVIDVFSGLPPGFSVVSENETALNFVFPGGSTSCMLITGTATAGQVGSYPLTVSGLSWATVLGTPTSQPFNVDYYTLEIVMPTGVEQFTSNVFEVKQNAPNPIRDFSTVEFYLPKANSVTVSVFDLLGKVLQSENVVGTQGSNKYNLDASNLSNGIYFYSLTSANKTITKRFVVNK